MVNQARERPRLTPKGERTRARIVQEAAVLIHERGVAGTTLDDVKAAAEVSGSQMYHYFPDKNDLLQAVIDYQADATVSNQRHADLGSAEGVQAWRDMVDLCGGARPGKGRLPPRLARRPARRERPGGPVPDRRRVRTVDNGNQPRAQVPSGQRAALRPASTRMTSPSPCSPRSREDYLLAQVQRSTRPFETAVDTLLALTIGG